MVTSPRTEQKEPTAKQLMLHVLKFLFWWTGTSNEGNEHTTALMILSLLTSPPPINDPICSQNFELLYI